MNGLHEYEAWLDDLDKKFYLDGNTIVYEFDITLTFSLTECSDFDAIEKQAKRLLKAISKNKDHLPKEYMIKRLLQLVSQGTGQSFEKMFAKLNQRWGKFNFSTGEWNA